MVQKKSRTALIMLMACGNVNLVFTKAYAGNGHDSPVIPTEIATANPREGTPDTLIAPGFTPQPIATGTDPLENLSGIISIMDLSKSF